VGVKFIYILCAGAVTYLCLTHPNFVSGLILGALIFFPLGIAYKVGIDDEQSFNDEEEMKDWRRFVDGMGRLEE
jgi:hypothetical protein